MAEESRQLEHREVPQRRHQSIVAAVVSAVVAAAVFVVAAGCSSKDESTKSSESKSSEPAKPEYGTQVDLVTGLTQPRGVAVDAAGTVYVADGNGNHVLKQVGSGPPATLGYVSAPSDIAVDSAGVIYVAATDNQVVQMAPGAKEFSPPLPFS
ncbi:MAG: serine/threonine protein kinase, bacterial, partial [Mycobacterium sp.]|nr:serine/threonine protein kinase, bacterial [Mycobacterium sp.]